MKKKLEITIPNNLDDITYDQYFKFYKMMSDDLSEAAAIELMITIFCNVSLEDIKLLKQTHINDIVGRLNPLLEKITSNEAELKHRFFIGDVEFGLIPNLEDISYGENKDITSFMSDEDTMHLAMAVLFRPIVRTHGDTYEIEEYTASSEHYETMMKMPVSAYLGARVFFWNLMKELLLHIPNYLEEQLGKEKISQLMQKVSTNTTGEDMMKSFAWLKEI